MGRRAKGRRERLFQQGVAAWQRATGDEREIYVCPLCGWGFTRLALESNPSLLSLEDVPSRAVGGRPLVLTCRTCNSTAGHSVDKAVAAREEARRISDALLLKVGTYSRFGRMTLDGIQTNAHIRIAPDLTSIDVPVKKNHPSVRQQQLEQWKRRRADGTLSLTLSFPLPGYDERKAQLGDLKAAYLTAFATFGYNLAFHPRLHIVRRQLRYPERALITGAWLPNRKGRSEVFLMKAPVPCLAVSLRTFDVILPWINGPEDTYSAVSSAFETGRFNATVVPVDRPQPPEMLIDFDPDVAPASLSPPVSFED